MRVLVMQGGEMTLSYTPGTNVLLVDGSRKLYEDIVVGDVVLVRGGLFLSVEAIRETEE